MHDDDASVFLGREVGGVEITHVVRHEDGIRFPAVGQDVLEVVGALEQHVEQVFSTNPSAESSVAMSGSRFSSIKNRQTPRWLEGAPPSSSTMIGEAFASFPSKGGLAGGK